MSITKGVSNKIKGKWKQIDGGVNQQAGKGVKGGLQKIEGKVQEGFGNAQLNATTAKSNRPRKRDSM